MKIAARRSDRMPDGVVWALPKLKPSCGAIITGMNTSTS